MRINDLGCHFEKAYIRSRAKLHNLHRFSSSTFIRVLNTIHVHLGAEVSWTHTESKQRVRYQRTVVTGELLLIRLMMLYTCAFTYEGSR